MNISNNNTVAHSVTHSSDLFLSDTYVATFPTYVPYNDLTLHSHSYINIPQSLMQQPTEEVITKEK